MKRKRSQTMGFLDHSTNNIIVDAVLTDRGREKLADASTSKNFIQSYSFADDEVDYSLITKYGVIVGKEKIEKNTPIFEASTNAEFAVTNFLATSENANVEQPSVTSTATNTTLTSTSKESTVTIGVKDDNALLDTIRYEVEFDRRYVIPTGNVKPKRVSGSKNMFKVTLEANRKEDLALPFKRSELGEKELKKAGKTKQTTRIAVKSNTGQVKRIPFTVDYKK